MAQTKLPINPLFLPRSNIDLKYSVYVPILGDTFLTTLTEAKASALCTKLFPAELISTYQQLYCEHGKTIKAFPGYYLASHSAFIQQMRQLLTANACSFQALVDLYEQMYNKTYDHPPREPKRSISYNV